MRIRKYDKNMVNFHDPQIRKYLRTGRKEEKISRYKKENGYLKNRKQRNNVGKA